MAANDTQVDGNHYKSEFQHWDYAWTMGMDSHQYPITKYLARWPDKHEGTVDLKKVLHYIVKYRECAFAEGHLSSWGVLMRTKMRDPIMASEYTDKWLEANNVHPVLRIVIHKVVQSAYVRYPVVTLDEAHKLLTEFINSLEAAEELQGQQEHAQAIKNEGA